MNLCKLILRFTKCIKETTDAEEKNRTPKIFFHELWVSEFFGEDQDTHDLGGGVGHDQAPPENQDTHEIPGRMALAPSGNASGSAESEATG